MALQKIGVGPHRLDLARSIGEQPQRADTGDCVAEPGRPDFHIGPRQAAQVEREYGFGRGLRVHPPQVKFDEGTGGFARQIVATNDDSVGR